MDSVCLQASFSTEQKQIEESKRRTKLLLPNLILLGWIWLCGHSPSGSLSSEHWSIKYKGPLHVTKSRQYLQGHPLLCTGSGLRPVSSTDSTWEPERLSQSMRLHCNHRLIFLFFRFFSAGRETHGTDLSVYICIGYSVLFLKHITLLWQKSTPALVLAAQGGSLLHPTGSPSSVPLHLSLRFRQLLVTKPIQCTL